MEGSIMKLFCVIYTLYRILAEKFGWGEQAKSNSIYQSQDIPKKYIK